MALSVRIVSTKHSARLANATSDLWPYGPRQHQTFVAISAEVTHIHKSQGGLWPGKQQQLPRLHTLLAGAHSPLNSPLRANNLFFTTCLATSPLDITATRPRPQRIQGSVGMVIGGVVAPTGVTWVRMRERTVRQHNSSGVQSIRRI